MTQADRHRLQLRIADEALVDRLQQKAFLDHAGAVVAR